MTILRWSARRSKEKLFNCFIDFERSENWYILISEWAGKLFNIFLDQSVSVPLLKVRCVSLLFKPVRRYSVSFGTGEVCYFPIFYKSFSFDDCAQWKWKRISGILVIVERNIWNSKSDYWQRFESKYTIYRFVMSYNARCRKAVKTRYIWSCGFFPVAYQSTISFT